MPDMTELEIQNFAHNFNNLIQTKNREIARLKAENHELRATIRQLAQPGKKITAREVSEGNRPVYCINLKSKESGFWGIPLNNRMGVICNTKGVYRYSDYDKTWYALSSQPEE